MRSSRALAFICLAALTAVFAPRPAAAEGCLDCHDKAEIGAGERSVHPPFADDDCGSCHQDHGDEGRLVLTEQGNTLCEQCHDPGEEALLRRHGGARGRKAACTTCHDPHRSAQARLLVANRHRPLAFGRCDACHRWDGRLVKPTAQLCRGCHTGAEYSRRDAHSPVASGDCTDCHDPHASREPKLLAGRYRPGRWIDGEGDVALCLGCHDREAFFSPAAAGTRFRAAETNYHELHLGSALGQRRLSCRNCHEAHAADSPRLVRRELDCDGVPCLKLDYRRSDTGGTCVSGCHAPESYASGEGGGAPAPLRPAATAGAQAARPEMTEVPSLKRSIDRGCIGCHQAAIRRFAAKNIHAPVRAGACSSCHLDHGQENRLVLADRIDRLCARCHILRGARAAATHGGFPIEGSRCTECHDPHGSAAPALLHARRHAPFADGDCAACHGAPAAGWRIADRGSGACGECHDAVGRLPHRHTAVAAQGCTGCHGAHVAREPRLLREAGAGLCFGCHPRERFARQTTHAPVAEGDCAACHAPHEAAVPLLLTGPYPLEQFVRFAAGAYALCWGCHDEGAIVDPARATETGFADGARNLHALHLRDRSSVNALGTRVQPGINCRNCHDPHATDGPRLVRRALDCNGVPCLQMEYRQTPRGGRCLGGCHVSQAYERAR